MYAIAILRYRRPIDQILPDVDRHRAYLRELKQRGLLLASGPLDPRYGGALLLRIPDGPDREDAIAQLNKIRDDDPFTHLGHAQYELCPWTPTVGLEDLDKL